MKKSNTTRIVIGVALVAAITCLIIFWPKKAQDSNSPDATITEDAEHKTPENVDAQNISSDKAAESHKETLPSSVSSEDPKMKKIESLLQHSRVFDEFKAMDDLLEAQLEQIQDAAQLSPADQEDLEKLKKIISSEALLKKYKEMMYERFDEKELAHLDELYQDPLVAKMKEAQVYNQSREGQKDMMEFFKNFKPDSIPADRAEHYRNIDKATGATENTMKMLRNVGDMSGNLKNDPKAKKSSDDLANKMRPAVEKMNFVQNSKIFGDYSASDLENVTKTMNDGVFQKDLATRQELSSNAMKEATALVAEKEKMHQEEKNKK